MRQRRAYGWTGGTTASYTQLNARILNVPPSERRIDLFLMLHIDSDHIGGARPLLADVDIWGCVLTISVSTAENTWACRAVKTISVRRC